MARAKNVEAIAKHSRQDDSIDAASLLQASGELVSRECGESLADWFTLYLGVEIEHPLEQSPSNNTLKAKRAEVVPIPRTGESLNLSWRGWLRIGLA